MIDYQYLAGGIVRTEQRYTPQGAAVTTFTLAQNDSRKTDTGEWEDTRKRYIDCTIWNDQRDNGTPWADLAADLQPGDKVVVHGKLVTETWQTKDGDNRSKLAFQARELYTQPTRQPTQKQATGWAVQDSRGGFSGANTGTAGEDKPPF